MDRLSGESDLVGDMLVPSAGVLELRFTVNTITLNVQFVLRCVVLCCCVVCACLCVCVCVCVCVCLVCVHVHACVHVCSSGSGKPIK